MVQLFPTRNAIFEYIDKFVDHDVAWAASILYWLTYSAIVPFQILTASRFLEFWLDQSNLTRIFTYSAPLLLLVINIVPVKYFGWIETIGGALKLALVFIMSILLFVVYANDTISKNFIEAGFQANQDYVSSAGEAFAYVLPIVAFGYEGIESLAMASFEARDTGKTKRLIPLWIHGTIPVAYFFLTLGSVLTVDWQDPALPSSYNSGADSGAGRVGGSQGSCGGKSPPNSVVILGIFKGVNAFGQDEFRPCLGRGAINAAGVLNGILVFTTMSAASAALYVSSRTLYGLTYRESRTDGWVKRYFRWATGTVWTLTGAPAGAVVMSVVSWWWLIILDEARRGGIKPATDFMHILGTTLSVSVLIVWAVLCFAYLRFYYWTWRESNTLSASITYRRYVPCDKKRYKAKGVTFAQPSLALFGFVACTTVLVLVSNTMWKRGSNTVAFFAAFLSVSTNHDFNHASRSI
ncbi:hypothetical protein MCOR27_007033 [Pyricularia oryzae]|nr:hypothetical protein MCOR01_002170 [Pyricularia oryzae]KAI6261268.1 hypothetical protein MCOR19_002439 [Pyricularia oryzae]KAI6275319.1 hypothetical protein MCOR27_007033 [Pyricularia oryzae]KAI6288237.1 hypothetical protein MCOR26_000242 [Pyricularia oryzae]KAI6316545.1 hypothetical protein MCOR34_004310 [Pyricularia oryzae]